MIVDFPQRAAPSHWQEEELRQLVELLGNPAMAAGATGWDVGLTERGEPQFYVLGPAPDHECVLSVSRLAHAYVLEDGAGRVLSEAPALHVFGEQAVKAAARAGRSFVARATLVICAIRLTIEEKLEPIFEESQELLVRVAPQMAAFV